MSALREQRARIYGYDDSGTEGFVSGRYTFRAERWALVVQRGGRKEIIATAPESKTDAIIDFDPHVDVRKDDLVVVGDDRYFLRGSTVQRTPPAQLWNAERISEEVFQKLVIVDPDDPDALDDATYDESVVES